VLFTNSADKPGPGESGDITFYKSPGPDNRENIQDKQAPGTLRIAYVYAWEHNDYEDSQWVLVGGSPTIKSAAQEESAFIKTVYGWCQTSRVFSWNSGTALVPNRENNARAYIFKSDRGLMNFYGKAGANSVPGTADLLIPDSYKMWKDSRWPFLLERRFYNRQQDYIKLICQVDAGIMKPGYAVEKDPRFSAVNQFKEVYLFKRSEIDKIKQDLETTLEVLKPRKINTLCKELVEWVYVEEYDPGKTFNEYALMNDGITYKKLAILFDNTQDRIDKLAPGQFDEIEAKITAVKARLENIIADQTGARFFGPTADPYIWLYEEELP